jgi:hypothetical protein
VLESGESFFPNLDSHSECALGPEVGGSGGSGGSSE